MADSCMKVERGFEYHANFIYNQPKLKNNRHKNPDWETSLEVVKHIVELMRDWGYDKTYYHERDALPGSNIFTELFTAVKKSSFTMVIFTKGFLHDCWGKYKSQAAFSKLLDDSKSNRFIAIYVDIDDDRIPDELRNFSSMSFSANWKDGTNEWNKLHNLIKHVSNPIQDTGRDLFPATGNTPNNQGIQQDQHHTGRHDLHSTINTELQHSQRNLIRGVQETQPPNLRRAGGSNVLANGPLNGNVFADGPCSADVALNTLPFSSQSPVDDRQNLSTEESTTNRLSNDPSDMTTPVDMTTTSNRTPPYGEANATTSGLAQGQSSQTIQREDSVGTNVKRLVSNANQDGDDLIDSSLNQTDLEADNEASEQLNSVDTPAPQIPLKLEQSMIKSGHTTPFSGQDCEQLNDQGSRLERIKSDDNDQDDSGLDLASLQRSDNYVNISPESVGVNRCNDQSSSPTSKDPDNPSFFNWMTSLVTDKETRIKAARHFTNMLVKFDQSFM